MRCDDGSFYMDKDAIIVIIWFAGFSHTTLNWRNCGYALMLTLFFSLFTTTPH